MALPKSARPGQAADPRLITELSAKTLGIVGFGHIGQEVARRAAAFDTNIVYADPLVVRTEIADPGQARRVELEELLRISDYITLHAPLTEGTRNLIHR
jgi:phosphoglycerate dehydrogenase-like enzyme